VNDQVGENCLTAFLCGEIHAETDSGAACIALLASWGQGNQELHKVRKFAYSIFIFMQFIDYPFDFP
jgi:hypothetical protein